MEIKELFDYLSKTELCINPENINLIDLSYINNEKIIINEQTEFINLPFDECFFKLKEDLFILIQEVNPEKYNFSFFVVDADNTQISYHTSTLVFKNNKWTLLNIPDYVTESQLENDCLIVKGLLIVLDKISFSSHDLYVTSPYRFIYRNREKKISKKIKKSIYIYLSKNEDIKVINKNYENIKTEKQISWSVRGHWRRLHNIESLGKNKNGDYIVTGYTWINNYVKGNKNTLPNRSCYVIK